MSQSTFKALLIIGTGLVLVTVLLGGIGGILRFALPYNPHADVRAFQRDIAEFQGMADAILTKKVSPIYEDWDYAPSPALAELGIKSIRDAKDGTLAFIYRLEIFDGPTRLLIYDPNNVEKGDHGRHITRPPPQWIESVGPWTYIKNND
jgi:hypothetical protein